MDKEILVLIKGKEVPEVFISGKRIKGLVDIRWNTGTAEESGFVEITYIDKEQSDDLGRLITVTKRIENS